MLTGQLTRAPGEAVGAYAISQGTLAANANYTIAFTGNDLYITSTIWVDDNWQGSLSGQTVTAPAGEGARTGVVFTYGVNAFSTIQAGVSGAVANSTVNVLPGSYTGAWSA